MMQPVGLRAGATSSFNSAAAGVPSPVVPSAGQLVRTVIPRRAADTITPWLPDDEESARRSLEFQGCDIPAAARVSQTRSGTVPAWTAFLLSVSGLFVSAYLSYQHFTDSRTLACSDNGAVNCLKVTTSQWSVIAGVPIAVAGLAFFAAMTLLCAPTRSALELGGLRVIGVVVGTLMVLWLVYVEIFEVKAICLWCSAVHLITVLLLGTVLWWRQSVRADE